MGIFGILILLGICFYLYRTYFTATTYETKDERYNAEKARKQKELDHLLDKISRRGIENLTADERSRLDELSGKR